MSTITYTSPKYNRARTIALEVTKCMQARLDGRSWNAIGTASTEEEKATRAVLYGMECNVANLMDVRCSPEWAVAADEFAEEGGHDVAMIRRMMISVPRGARPLAPAPAPAPAPPSAPSALPMSAPEPATTPPATTLRAIPAPNAGAWVETDSGLGINLRLASTVGIYSDDDGYRRVYAELNGEAVLLYNGKHVDAYHDWVMSEVLGVAQFPEPPAPEDMEEPDAEDDESPEAEEPEKAPVATDAETDGGSNWEEEEVPF